MLQRITRLAPSPTGALHLGNARTFLANWAIARQRGWSVLMRIEDLDGPRIRSESIQETLDILRWLGMDHDGEVLRQGDDVEPYRAAMHTLANAGRAYACDLTRTQIEQATTAPHRDDRELRYPPDLRPDDATRFRFDREDTNYRLVVEPEVVAIDDGFAGRHEFRPDEAVGDFVVWTRRGTPAYQLAVVVDDARQRVTDVVRGDDLLPSAARQHLLYRHLDAPPPTWWHLPLVVGPDGRRLAKRHGDTRITYYRDRDVPPQRVVGLLGRWCGLTEDRREMSVDEFRDGFDLERLPHDPITFRPDDHAWLMDPQ
jgi:glutamyl-tRNA synthetase